MLTTAAAFKLAALSTMTSPTDLASVLNLTISTCKAPPEDVCAASTRSQNSEQEKGHGRGSLECQRVRRRQLHGSYLVRRLLLVHQLQDPVLDEVLCILYLQA